MLFPKSLGGLIWSKKPEREFTRHWDGTSQGLVLCAGLGFLHGFFFVALISAESAFMSSHRLSGWNVYHLCVKFPNSAWKHHGWELECLV